MDSEHKDLASQWGHVRDAMIGRDVVKAEHTKYLSPFDGGIVRFQLRLPTEIHWKLKIYAAHEHRSMHAEILSILERVIHESWDQTLHEIALTPSIEEANLLMYGHIPPKK